MRHSHNTAMRILVSGITLLATMGISSLLPALPLLAERFGIPLEGTWRIIVAFALPGLVCMPVLGVLADRVGRKRVLMPSLALFSLGGVACMFAQTYPQLLFFRLVQGVGGSAFGLLYMTIIADTWQGGERLRMMSRNAAVLGLGTAVSPALGGALASLDWRLPFLLPLSALPLMLLARRLPLLNPGLAIPFLAYAKSWISCARDKQTIVLLSLTLLTFVMLSGPLITCFPILAEQKFKASPLQSGLILGAASLASGLAATLLPRLYRACSTRALLLAAMALYSVGVICIAWAPALWLLLPSVLLYGLAQGLNIPLVSTLLAGQARDGQRASLMALNGILLRLGQNIGTALFGTLSGCFGPVWAISAGVIPALLMAVLAAGAALPALSRSMRENVGGEA